MHVTQRTAGTKTTSTYLGSPTRTCSIRIMPAFCMHADEEEDEEEEEFERWKSKANNFKSSFQSSWQGNKQRRAQQQVCSHTVRWGGVEGAGCRVRSGEHALKGWKWVA